MSTPVSTPALDEQLTAAPLVPWQLVVWDDPVNLMSYVTYVFQEYFRYPQAKAEELMLRVHNDGKAVVSTGGREEMERDVLAMQGYNLWSTMEQA